MHSQIQGFHILDSYFERQSEYSIPTNSADISPSGSDVIKSIRKLRRVDGRIYETDRRLPNSEPRIVYECQD